MKRVYDKPEVIVTAFESEGVMAGLTISGTAPSSAKKTDSNTINLGTLQ